MTVKTVRLGQLTDLITSGSTPLGGDKNYSSKGPVMFIRSQNVLMNNLDLSDVVYVSESIHQNMKRTHLQYGDVLLNITGASIGRVAPFLLEKTVANVNQHVCVIRPKPEVLLSRYLANFLSTPDFQLEIDRMQRGGTRQALTFAQVADFAIPLPPLSEQARIADILERIAKIQLRRKQIIQIAKQLSNSIVESISNTSAPLFTIEIALDRIIDYRGKTPVKTKSGIPLVTAKIIKQGRILEPKEFIASEDYDSWMRRGLPQEGDVLFTTEAPLGEVAQIEDPKIALAQRVLLLRGRKDFLDNCFLMAILKTPFVTQQLLSRASGSTVKGIRQSEFRKVEIPIPPYHEQIKFKKVFKRCQDLQVSLESADRKLSILQKSMLDQAFSQNKGEFQLV